ncbi:hypothetical protein CRV01_08565 [Arcobacter sp. CECT 8983]|uniref:hypothetical protein n=1 Tax=Arcobacter sp. CECT 8983 TaxID=2044508 RepID=UPI00100A71ED|nr:hypothetical protein [Arcobacter sp. CECT 8983]RXJ89518.1 hypothetical protein CRV01_08565 [Arcobacter sp. CECT 8983]
MFFISRDENKCKTRFDLIFCSYAIYTYPNDLYCSCDYTFNDYLCEVFESIKHFLKSNGRLIINFRNFYNPKKKAKRERIIYKKEKIETKERVNVSIYLSGAVNFPDFALESIAEHFGVTIDYLKGRQKELPMRSVPINSSDDFKTKIVILDDEDTLSRLTIHKVHRIINPEANNREAILKMIGR